MAKKKNKIITETITDVPTLVKWGGVDLTIIFKQVQDSILQCTEYGKPFDVTVHSALGCVVTPRSIVDRVFTDDGEAGGVFGVSRRVNGSDVVAFLFKTYVDFYELHEITGTYYRSSLVCNKITVKTADGLSFCYNFNFFVDRTIAYYMTYVKQEKGYEKHLTCVYEEED